MEKTNENYTCICIDDLEVIMSVGLLDHERCGTQRLIVNMKLYVPHDYLQSVTPETIVDYGKISEKVLEWEKRNHVELLETLTENLFEIAFSYDAVQAATVSVKKPDIIDQARVVGVEAHRVR